MASRLNPYISFPGNAREALEFYQGVFGGDLTRTRSASTARQARRTLTRSCMASSRRRAASR